MAFNKNLAYRSQGVDASMYSDDPAEAQKLMDEDMAARWDKSSSKFRQQMVGQRAKESQARPQQAARQVAPRGGFGGGNSMYHPMAQAQGNHLQGMANATMGAFAQSNAARINAAQQNRAYNAQQADRDSAAQMAQAQREHEMNMLRHQTEAKQAHNSNLMQAAGMGSRIVAGNGKGSLRHSLLY
jgi:hypothetical protein